MKAVRENIPARPWMSRDGVDVWNMDSYHLDEVLDADSVDVIVSDPPYGINISRGRKWDRDSPAFAPGFHSMLLRVCKPGALMLMFGQPSTWHRMVCAAEDAGWTIVDQVCWLKTTGIFFGMNMGLKMDLLNGIDVKDGRESVGKRNPGTYGISVHYKDRYRPQTREGCDWDGWSTGLRAAFEPIMVARRTRRWT